MKVLVTVCTPKGERFSYTRTFPTTVDAVMAALDDYGVCTVRARALPAFAPTLH